LALQRSRCGVALVCLESYIPGFRPLNISLTGPNSLGGMIIGDKRMILCNLCGQAKKCLKKKIDGQEYDICSDCWTPLAEKLKGKGRATKDRETVFLPPLKAEPEPPPPKPGPKEPPKNWGGIGKPQ
jgi:hypothetical protein